MPRRWLLIYAVSADVADRLPDVLAHHPSVAVAREQDVGDSVVVTVEVDADPDVVDVVARQVREADPDAARLHDSLIDVPDDADPATVSLDFEVGDDPTPCPHCAGWRHERTVDGGGRPVLREWHRASCPEYLSWL